MPTTTPGPRFAAIVVVAVACSGLVRLPREAPTVTVQVLAINDFHGNLEPPAGANGLINGKPAGGAEYLATHLARAVAEQPNSIVVGAGDVIGASPLVSSLFHDEPTVAAMNAMHLAVTSVGNHEFDKGQPELFRLARGGCHPIEGCQAGTTFRGARFQYLSANVVRTRTRAPLFRATAVRTVGGVKIGFIGETLRDTPRIVSPAGTRGLTFLDEATIANAQARALARQGVHAIVLLIHEGGRQAPEDAAADPNGCADFTGSIVPIVRRLTSEIRVVISGHTHRFYNCEIDGHVVTSAASYGRMITRVALQIDRSTDRVVRASAVNEVVTRDVAKDPEQTRLLERYEPLARAAGDRVVGTISEDVKRDANAAGESPLGEVIADAELAATSAPEAGGAVIAFMNSGGIRADLVARRSGQGGAPAELTYRDLFTVQPFGNVLAVITLTGEQVRQVLEQQFDNPGPGQRSMLQVSNGFTYEYRNTAPAGQHIDPASIMIQGRRLAPGDRVRVVASDFVIDSGLYPALGAGTDRTAGMIDIDAFVAYVKARSPLVAGPLDRIRR
ncbi:MAG TPA: bifunctional metallophosphatase/5'-nucleotidase, partial [Vicinamibacterales bacterium]|nr:bifunctional metallophosphatase/5'-nucleotidase [Vicinamibacterales bacterium]